MIALIPPASVILVEEDKSAPSLTDTFLIPFEDVTYKLPFDTIDLTLNPSCTEFNTPDKLVKVSTPLLLVPDSNCRDVSTCLSSLFLYCRSCLIGAVASVPNSLNPLRCSITEFLRITTFFAIRKEPSGASNWFGDTLRPSAFRKTVDAIIYFAPINSGDENVPIYPYVKENIY